MRSGPMNAEGSVEACDERFAARGSIDYGRLVANFPTEISPQIAVPQSRQGLDLPAKNGADFAHLISVCSGYVGLAVGFALTGAAVNWLAF